MLDPMNPSTALAHVVIDELIRGGVEEFVVAPGSRNAPLSLAIAGEAAVGRVRMHVRIDERSAAFLGLGLAKGSGRACAVVTTSGTAAANLHPAILEAAHSDLPLIVITADRPPELRATGANQTTNQQYLFGSAVRHFAEIGPAEAIVGQVRYWRAGIARAVHASATGPVHLNVPLREPLVGPVEGGWVEPLDGRDGDLPWTMVVDHLPHTFDIALDLPARGVLVVAHDAVGISPAQLETFAHQLGWPIVAENPLAFAQAVPHAALLLADATTRQDLQPDAIVVVGRPVLSRSIAALVAESARVVVIDPGHTWSDPGRRAGLVLSDLPQVEDDHLVDSTWIARWHAHSKRVADAIADLPEWSEGRVAARIAQALPTPSVLFVGASRPIRDLEAFATPRHGVVAYANRGLAGIDGSLSTAMGLALASEDSAFAVMGDLTFLHDINGLLVDDHVPNLTVLVIDNNGGGIFSTLPQSGVEYFESVFGTPHRRDLVAIARAHGADAHRVTSHEELDAYLKQIPSGIRVLVLEMPGREENARMLRDLATKISAR